MLKIYNKFVYDVIIVGVLLYFYGLLIGFPLVYLILIFNAFPFIDYSERNVEIGI